MICLLVNSLLSSLWSDTCILISLRISLENKGSICECGLREVPLYIASYASDGAANGVESILFDNQKKIMQDVHVLNSISAVGLRILRSCSLPEIQSNQGQRYSKNGLLHSGRKTSYNKLLYSLVFTVCSHFLILRSTRCSISLIYDFWTYRKTKTPMKHLEKGK